MRNIRHGPIIAISMLGLFGAGCSFLPAPSNPDGAKPETEERMTRIEIELDDPDRDLPCNVIYRPDSTTKELLWRARFERGFCDAKAREALAVLESKGWRCRVELTAGRPAGVGRVTSAWRCTHQATARTAGRSSIPIPAPRPGDARHRLANAIDPALKAATERDRRSIGRNFVLSAVGHGDVNDDGLSDAVVVLEDRTDDHSARQKIIMAYLFDGTIYYLVDTQVLTLPRQSADDVIEVTIEDGVIQVGLRDAAGRKHCCVDAKTGLPTLALILRARDLFYVDDPRSSDGARERTGAPG